MKTCTKCKRECEEEDFYRIRKDSEYRHTICKVCQNSRKRDRHSGRSAGRPAGSKNPPDFKKERAFVNVAEIDPVRLLDKSGKYLRLTRIINAIRKNAYRRKIMWDLTVMQAAEILVQDCTYCTQPSLHKEDLERYNPYNGIDRLDSNLGYVLGNVAPCCRRCNIAKATMSVEEFKELITKIYTNFCDPT